MKQFFLSITLILVFSACSMTEDVEFVKQHIQTLNWENEKTYYVKITLESMMGSYSTNEFYFGDRIEVTLETNIPYEKISYIQYVSGFETILDNRDGYSDSSPTLYEEDGIYIGTKNLYAIKPGHWNVQVWINTIYDEISPICSNTESIIINFPRIIEDDGEQFSSDFEKIWKKMLKATNKNDKNELGAWLYANIEYGCLHYEIDMNNLIKGETVNPCEGGSISNTDIQGALEEIIPDYPLGIDESRAKFAVAYFHTHTPLTYCESDDVDSRVVGISEGDEKWAEAYKIPIFVYDYKAEAQAGGTGRILIGHSLDAEAEYLFYDRVTQRETPQNNYTETLINLSN